MRIDDDEECMIQRVKIRQVVVRHNDTDNNS